MDMLAYKDSVDSNSVISDTFTSPLRTLPQTSMSKSVKCGTPEMKLSPNSPGSSVLGLLPQNPVTVENVLRGLLYDGHPSESFRRLRS